MSMDTVKQRMSTIGVERVQVPKNLTHLLQPLVLATNGSVKIDGKRVFLWVLLYMHFKSFDCWTWQRSCIFYYRRNKTIYIKASLRERHDQGISTFENGKRKSDDKKRFSSCWDNWHNFSGSHWEHANAWPICVKTDCSRL